RLAECAEAVPVPAARLEADRLGMHAVPPCRFGDLVAAGDDALELLVVGDLPAYRLALAEAVAGEAGPEHHPVGAGLARGDAEGEAAGVGAARAAHEPGHRRRRGCAGDEAAPAWGLDQTPTSSTSR